MLFTILLNYKLLLLLLVTSKLIGGEEKVLQESANVSIFPLLRISKPA